DVGREVRERERHALVLDDRLAERLSLNCIVAGELERRASDADRLRCNHRTRSLERAKRSRAAPLNGGGSSAFVIGGRRGRRATFRFAALRYPFLQALVATEQILTGHPAILEHDLTRVRRPATELVELAQQPQPGRSLRDDEHALAAMASFGLDGRDYYMDVGDPAV